METVSVLSDSTFAHAALKTFQKHWTLKAKHASLVRAFSHRATTTGWEQEEPIHAHDRLRQLPRVVCSVQLMPVREKHGGVAVSNHAQPPVLALQTLNVVNLSHDVGTLSHVFVTVFHTHSSVLTAHVVFF